MSKLERCSLRWATCPKVADVTISERDQDKDRDRDRDTERGAEQWEGKKMQSVVANGVLHTREIVTIGLASILWTGILPNA